MATDLGPVRATRKKTQKNMFAVQIPTVYFKCLVDHYSFDGQQNKDDATHIQEFQTGFINGAFGVQSSDYTDFLLLKYYF